MQTKICSKCMIEKPITEYYKNSKCKYGVVGQCKSCYEKYRQDNKENAKQWRKEYYQRQDVKERQKQNNKIYYQQNKEKFAEYDKKYREEHKEQLRNYKKRIYQTEEYKQKRKEYNDKNREQISEYGKNYRDKPEVKERNRLYNKKYYEQHKEQRRQYDKERHQKQYYNNDCYRVYRILSAGIYHALKENKKERQWETLVSYNLEQLKEHLEKQFTPEINWDNFGSYWEIDHIIPRNLFNYTTTDDEQFKICWSLANLRPLEKSLNRRRPKDGRDIPKEQAISILGLDLYNDIMEIEK